jgi:hypothetical protein
MKIFHKKFLNQEVLRDNNVEIPTDGKSKINYLLHQLLIWGVIFSVAYFIVKFYTLYV